MTRGAVCSSATEQATTAICRRPMLVIGHPGHELQVFGWMSGYRPQICILTDGSGNGSACSRTESSLRLANAEGAKAGPIFGLMSDREMYRAILDQRFTLFLQIADQLAAHMISNGIDFVVADAMEGFNPTHDVCRAVVDAAVLIADGQSAIKLKNYRFSLAEWELQSSPRHDDDCLHSLLDDSTLARKVSAAEGYVELRSEVNQALQQLGQEHFRLECLRRVDASDMLAPFAAKPYYETVGERRVSDGTYASVIRHDEHIRPIVDELRRYAMRGRVGKQARPSF